MRARVRRVLASQFAQDVAFCAATAATVVGLGAIYVHTPYQ